MLPFLLDIRFCSRTLRCSATIAKSANVNNIVIMPNNPKVTTLDKKISQLIEAIHDAEKGNSEALKELLLHIHKPGWTTPAELAFSYCTLDALLRQVKSFNEHVNGLAKCAKMVSQGVK